jgi:D-threo-aldose 1-dehydrogenase
VTAGRLGRRELGPLGFGGAPLGNLYARVEPAAALDTVRAGWEMGLRYFDTAPHYGHGLSEHRIGHVLRELPRGQFVLSTKVGRLLSPDPAAPESQHGYVGGLPFVQRFDYSYDGALRSLEDSLQRLGLARVDIVYIHDLGRDTHGEEQPRRFRQAMEGAYPALERLRAAGAVRAIGLGVNEWQVCRDALAHGDFDLFLLAGRYTLLEQPALAELMPLCQARGVGIVVGGPFNSGILATGAAAGARYDYGPAPREVVAKVAGIEAICRRYDVPLRAAALRFPLGHPAVVSVIPGARSAGEVRENVGLMRRPIDPALWEEIKAEGLLAREAPTPRDW